MLTFSNGVKLYMTGGTSTTKQMAEMANMEIDYAFYRCDGVYNMGLKEAARCAEPVEAKHNIPYHNSTSNRGEMFDRDLATAVKRTMNKCKGAGFRKPAPLVLDINSERPILVR